MSQDQVLRDIYYEWREVEMKILWLMINDPGRNTEQRVGLLRKVQSYLFRDSRDDVMRQDFIEEIEWLLEQLKENV